MDTKEVLNNAAEIIESNWTRQNYAVDKFNLPTNALSEEAVNFCMIGGIVRAIGFTALDPYLAAMVKVEAAIEQEYGEALSIPTFNDDVCKNGKEAADVLRKAATLND